MTNEHPITPPQKLVDQWVEEWHHSKQGTIDLDNHLTTQAAQWGADQELEACITWMDEMELAGSGDIEVLRAARRPKPPSLKEQALERLELAKKYVDVEPIRRALEALPNKPPSLKEQALAAQQRMWDGTSNHDDWNLIRRALEQLPDAHYSP